LINIPKIQRMQRCRMQRKYSYSITTENTIITTIIIIYNDEPKHYEQSQVK